MKRIISILLVIALLLAGCGKTVMTWQDQYDLGLRYLSEGNYEDAILAFNAAIEIDPKRAEAYVQLAEIYTELGDEEKLSEIMELAAEQFGEEEFIKLLLEEEPQEQAEPEEYEEPEEQTEPEEEVPEEEARSVYEELGQAQYTQLAVLTSTIYDAQNCSGWFGGAFDSDDLYHRFLFAYIYLRAGEDVMPNEPVFTHSGDGITHSTISISESEMNALQQYFFGSPISGNGNTYWEVSPTFTVTYENGTYSLRAPAGDPGYPLNLTAVTGMTDNGDGTYLVNLSSYDIIDHDVLRNCDPFTYFAMSPEEMAGREELNYIGDLTAIVFWENGQFYLKSMDF